MRAKWRKSKDIIKSKKNLQGAPLYNSPNKKYGPRKFLHENGNDKKYMV